MERAFIASQKGTHHPVPASLRQLSGSSPEFPRLPGQLLCGD